MALVVRKHALRKKLLVFSLCLLLFFSNPLIINQLLKYWEPQSNIDKKKIYDTGVILSGFMSKDEENGSLNLGKQQTASQKA
jgi:hypothetical protein